MNNLSGRIRGKRQQNAERGAGTSDDFSPVKPWPLPRKEDCLFYHSMTYPNGETVEGVWDLRGVFAQYIGNYPIKSKTVLDVGTATGFLAFESERRRQGDSPRRAACLGA